MLMRGRRARFAISAAATAALILLAPPLSARRSGAAPLAGIPNVKIHHYKVSGRTASELARSLDRRRPTDPNDGERVDALTHWTIEYQWRGDERVCDLSTAKLRFEATIEIPKLSRPSEVPADLRRQWEAYVDALMRHESVHVRHAFDHKGEVLRAIRSSRCSTAKGAADRAIQALAQHDLDFDRETDHGRLQGAVFP